MRFTRPAPARKASSWTRPMSRRSAPSISAKRRSGGFGRRAAILRREAGFRAATFFLAMGLSGSGERDAHDTRRLGLVPEEELPAQLQLLRRRDERGKVEPGGEPDAGARRNRDRQGRWRHGRRERSAIGFARERLRWG